MEKSKFYKNIALLAILVLGDLSHHVTRAVSVEEDLTITAKEKKALEGVLLIILIYCALL